MRLSLRYKAAVMIAFTQVMLLGLLLAVNLHSIRIELEAQLQKQADSTLALLTTSVIHPLLASDLATLQVLADDVAAKSDIPYVSIVNDADIVVAEAGAPLYGEQVLTDVRDIKIDGRRYGSIKLQLARHGLAAALSRMMHSNVTIMAVEIVLVAMISVSLGWYLTRHLKALSKGARAVAAGDYGIRVAIDSDDEVGDLTRHFNAMTAQLADQMDAMKQANRRFRDMADNTSDWLWEADIDGRYTYVSPQVQDLLGYGAKQLTGASAFALMVPEDVPRLRDAFEQAKLERRPFYGFQYRARHEGGSLVYLEVNGTPILNDDQVLIGYRGVTRDITRRKEDELKLIYLAEHDALTGLFDRKKFIELLDGEIAHARQTDAGAVTILLMDIDGFKRINDTHGHVAGDAILRSIAELLAGQLGDGGTLARLGGDEFGIIVRNADAQTGKHLAKRIISAIETAPFTVGEEAVKLFAGVGICAYPSGGGDSQTLLAHADSAVTHAKSLGQNRYHVFDPSDTVLERMRHTVNWQTVIQHALNNGGLFLDLQAITPVASRTEARHFEALVRLRDEHGDVHGATEFIETAELTGQVTEIDKWVLREVLVTLATDAYTDATIAVNLSGRSLDIPDCCDYLERQVRNSGVEPHRIIFEITESAAVQEVAKAESFLSRMKRLGYRFSLDDFGAGYSSFSYLKHLPVDQIKIDGSFIRQLDRSREDQIFVRSIIQIAHELGLETVAEFVQSQAVLEMLAEYGIDYVQGFFIGRPASVAIEGPAKTAYKYAPDRQP